MEVAGKGHVVAMSWYHRVQWAAQPSAAPLPLRDKEALFTATSWAALDQHGAPLDRLTRDIDTRPFLAPIEDFVTLLLTRVTS